MASPTIPVSLSPSAGFCLKTASLDAGTYNAGSPTAIAVPRGLKIFVNIAWDKNVPPPPEGSEDAIQRAMDGQDPDELNPEGWFVPVIVSPGREDTDKAARGYDDRIDLAIGYAAGDWRLSRTWGCIRSSASEGRFLLRALRPGCACLAGKPSLVFDCIYNSTLKSRTLKDAAFKTFLVELALQRIEAQSNLHLSRTIGTPNIASKGALAKRTAHVPAALFPPAHPLHASASRSAPAKPLIEEVSASSPSPSPGPKKGILKSSAASPLASPGPDPGADAEETGLETPAWSWAHDGPALRITVLLPKLVLQLSTSSPRLLHLHVPGLYNLHIDVGAGDAAIQRAAFVAGAGPGAADMALMLKRARDFDVEGARAEWRVAEGRLVVYAKLPHPSSLHLAVISIPRDTPIKRRTPSNSPIADFKPRRTSGRYFELTNEMAHRFLGPMPVLVLLDEFLPRPLMPRPTDIEPFEIKPVSDYEAEFAKAATHANICPDFEFHHTTGIEDETFPFATKPDISLIPMPSDIRKYPAS
ncbi:hypothetical protein EVG20_g6209 [Dentipellis fragilis]|uniref:Uncharacterized protein n=1 Tax=Dentipellis fragilis TaxID=205917 RepID=A0A4Y9YPH1_9AGAM|nr:hypothetical protein EVG20_g6209 [Dentipellis fragilis]